MNKILGTRTGFALGVIATAALIVILGRLFPHPYNFTPIGAMALFVGVYMKDKKMAVGLTMLMMFFSDFLLQAAYWMGYMEFPGFYTTMPFVYLCFALMVGIGVLLRDRVKVPTLIAGTLAGSILFFLITNFAIWAFHMPHTWESLVACYTSAIPFFRNTLAGNFFYVGVFFGVFALAQKQIPSLAK